MKNRQKWEVCAQLDSGALRLKNVALEAGRHKYEVAESDLSQTKQILETIVQGITDGIMLISKDFKIVWANRAILKDTDCLPEDIIGKYCYKINHKTDSPCAPSQILCPVKEAVRTGKPIVTTHTHIDRQNKKRFVEVAAYPIRNVSGQVTHYVHITRDITEQKRSEEKLRDSESTCRTVFNSVNDAIAIFDVGNFKIMDINERGCEMFGSPCDRIRGLGIQKLTCNEKGYSKTSLIKFFRKAAQNQPQLFEWKLKKGAGRCIWVDINLKRAAIHGESRLIGVIRDITKRKNS